MPRAPPQRAALAPGGVPGGDRGIASVELNPPATVPSYGRSTRSPVPPWAIIPRPSVASSAFRRLDRQARTPHQPAPPRRRTANRPRFRFALRPAPTAPRWPTRPPRRRRPGPLRPPRAGRPERRLGPKQLGGPPRSRPNRSRPLADAARGPRAGPDHVPHVPRRGGHAPNGTRAHTHARRCHPDGSSGPSGPSAGRPTGRFPSVRGRPSRTMTVRRSSADRPRTVRTAGVLQRGIR
jgi:hypothetical protein